MWTEEKKNQSESSTVADRVSSKMVDSDLTGQLFQAVQQRNGSAPAVTLPSSTEEPSTSTSGIIPGAIAAAVFITFYLLSMPSCGSAWCRHHNESTAR